MCDIYRIFEPGVCTQCIVLVAWQLVCNYFNPISSTSGFPGLHESGEMPAVPSALNTRLCTLIELPLWYNPLSVIHKRLLITEKMLLAL